MDYVVRLAGATRSHPAIPGASPRATLLLTAMAKSIAFLNGRDYVIPSDIQTVFCETVAHRLLLEPSAEARGRTARDILRRS
ncbi:MAG: AAA family ATPase [Oscillospiraceae bacterium]